MKLFFFFKFLCIIRHVSAGLNFSRMRSEKFLFLSGGLGAGSCLTRFRRVCAERSPRVRFGVAIGRCNSAMRRACVWTFRVALVGNGG